MLSVNATVTCRNTPSEPFASFLKNQSTDGTDGKIVSECRLENGPERGLKTVSFYP